MYILAPQAVLPFQTLAMLYEEQGDTQKSLQVGRIICEKDVTLALLLKKSTFHWLIYHLY